MAIINKPSEHFETSLYTGTGSSLAISGLNFAPDLTWIKGRSGATNHALYDSVRGVEKDLVSNATSAETTETTGLTAFGTDGFTVGALAKLNTSSATYASWNWLGGGTAVSNTDGSITSSVSANTTAGFSIVSYTGNGTGGATIGHGLGAVPKMIIVKARSAIQSWEVYSSALGATKTMKLDTTAGEATTTSRWNNTAPTSTLFSVGTADSVNGSGSTYIAYCFANTSMIKCGSYTGNGSADGTFVYTGFKPAFVMCKRSSSTGNWELFDNKRDIDNVVGHFLEANNSGAESDLSASHTPLDFLSNGFKLRSSNLTGTSNINLSGSTYIYLAIAEQSFVTSTTNGSIPATAR